MPPRPQNYKRPFVLTGSGFRPFKKQIIVLILHNAIGARAENEFFNVPIHDTTVLRYATSDLRNEGAAHASSVYRPMSNCSSCRDVMWF